MVRTVRVQFADCGTFSFFCIGVGRRAILCPFVFSRDSFFFLLAFRSILHVREHAIGKKGRGKAEKQISGSRYEERHKTIRTSSSAYLLHPPFVLSFCVGEEQTRLVRTPPSRRQNKKKSLSKRRSVCLATTDICCVFFYHLHFLVVFFLFH